MAEKPSNVSKAVCFVAMYGVVVFGERLFELICPKTVYPGKTLADKAIKLGICPFLRTALNNHRREFRLLTWR
jgi:hypothetical protein